MTLLEAITPDPTPRNWPRTPRAASGHLRRIAPALRACGVDLHAAKTNGERRLHLTPTTKGAVPTVPTVPTDPDPLFTSDNTEEAQGR